MFFLDKILKKWVITSFPFGENSNFAGVRNAWVNKPIKAEYSNFWLTDWAAQLPMPSWKRRLDRKSTKIFYSLPNSSLCRCKCVGWSHQAGRKRLPIPSFRVGGPLSQVRGIIHCKRHYYSPSTRPASLLVANFLFPCYLMDSVGK